MSTSSHILGETEDRTAIQLFGPPNENGFQTNWVVQANHVKQVKADTIFLGCMDFRFQRCERLFMTEQMNMGKFDHIRVPGPDLIFAGGADTPEAKVVKSWIDKSIQLHCPNGIVLVGHWNCGGHPQYSDCEAEERGHEQAILESLQFLSSCYPDLRLTGVYSRLVGNQLTFRKKKLIPVSQRAAAPSGNGVLATA